jgi:hypothetical protein
MDAVIFLLKKKIFTKANYEKHAKYKLLISETNEERTLEMP